MLSEFPFNIFFAKFASFIFRSPYEKASVIDTNDVKLWFRFKEEMIDYFHYYCDMYSDNHHVNFDSTLKNIILSYFIFPFVNKILNVKGNNFSKKIDVIVLFWILSYFPDKEIKEFVCKIFFFDTNDLDFDKDYFRQFNAGFFKVIKFNPKLIFDVTDELVSEKLKKQFGTLSKINKMCLDSLEIISDFKEDEDFKKKLSLNSKKEWHRIYSKKTGKITIKKWETDFEKELKKSPLNFFNKKVDMKFNKISEIFFNSYVI